MVDKIELNREALKAITVDSRMDILKLLKEKSYTLSDIAEKLDFKKPTVKEHLDILVKAQLVDKEDTDRKWKYYSLTDTGKAIVDSKEVKVMFVFALNIVALAGSLLFMVKTFFLKNINTTFAAKSVADTAIMEESARGAPMMAQMVTEVPQTPWAKIISLILVIILTLTLGVFIGYYIKRKKKLF